MIALALDLVRWATRRVPLVATRLLCFSWVYLAAEAVSLLALLGVWVAAGFRSRALTVSCTDDPSCRERT